MDERVKKKVLKSVGRECIYFVSIDKNWFESEDYDITPTSNSHVTASHPLREFFQDLNYKFYTPWFIYCGFVL